MGDPRLAHVDPRRTTPQPPPPPPASAPDPSSAATVPPSSSEPAPPERAPPPQPPPATTAAAAAAAPESEPNPEAPGQVDGVDDRPTLDQPVSDNDGFKLRFCTVCASNNNRSMEGHLQLSRANFPVISFGTGSLVRLPGPSITEPNVYPFNVTSYAQMYDELLAKDPRLYRQNGILNMLGRNRGVKYGPERWQDWIVGRPRLPPPETLTAAATNGQTREPDKGSRGAEGGVVDVVITCEERCWDAVVDNLLDRGSPLNRPVHVINVDIRDNHEEALVGGRAILDLATALNETAVAARQAEATATATADTAGLEGTVSGVDGGAWDAGRGAARASFDAQVPDVLAAWQTRWPSLPAVWTLAWF